MSGVATILVRLCVILFGYAVAILAASLFLHLLAWPSLGLDEAHPDFVAKSALVVSVLLAALFISYYAFLPAALMLALAELGPFRSWLYFAFAGALAGIAAVILFEFTRHAGTSIVRPNAMPMNVETLGGSLSAGIVAGIAYWLIAGRSAGRWRERRQPISREPSES